LRIGNKQIDPLSCFHGSFLMDESKTGKSNSDFRDFSLADSPLSRTIEWNNPARTHADEDCAKLSAVQQESDFERGVRRTFRALSDVPS